MFDHTHLHEHKAPTTNVHIVQQPNDAADAARLYGECEEKAKRAVAEATVDRLGAHNELIAINCGVWYRADKNEEVMRVVFKLNGELYDMEVPVDRTRRSFRFYEVAAAKLVQDIAHVLVAGAAFKGGKA